MRSDLRSLAQTFNHNDSQFSIPLNSSAEYFNFDANRREKETTQWSLQNRINSHKLVKIVKNCYVFNKLAQQRILYERYANRNYIVTVYSGWLLRWLVLHIYENTNRISFVYLHNRIKLLTIKGCGHKTCIEWFFSSLFSLSKIMSK
jgi:hypothetical protein